MSEDTTNSPGHWTVTQVWSQELSLRHDPNGRYGSYRDLGLAAPSDGRISVLTTYVNEKPYEGPVATVVFQREEWREPGAEDDCP